MPYRLLALTLLFACLSSPAARAAESYDNCTGFISSLPAVISTQGTWCMDKDLSTPITTGTAIIVATNNVILDCNDFKLGGLAAGPGTNTYGVYANGRLNITVRNCNIRGFYVGVAMEGAGSGHVIEDNRIEASTLAGLSVSGSYSTARGNLVVDTGDIGSGSSSFYGMFASGDGILLLDNTIAGVAAQSDTANYTGIYASGDAIIGRNQVVGLDDVSSGVVAGISTAGSRPIIHDNVVKIPTGVTGTFGVYCTTAAGTATSNIIVGADSPVQACTGSGNTVNPN